MSITFGNSLLSKFTPQETTSSTKDPYGDARNVEKRVVIDLKGNILGTQGVSSLWDRTSSVSGGTVTQSGVASSSSGAELQLATTTSSTSSALLQSIERGIVPSSYGCECAIAVRFASVLTSPQYARWGFNDQADGYFFQLTGSVLQVGYLQNSTATVVNQSSFNIDPMDGTGPSGVTLDLTKGIIYRILMGNSYQSVVWILVMTDTSGNQLNIPVHQTSITTGLIPYPHQPLRCELVNNTATTAGAMFVAERQFCVLGAPSTPQRVSSCWATTTLSTSGTGSINLLAVRKKSTGTKMVVYVHSIDCVVSNYPGILTVTMAATPTFTPGGTTYSSPNGSTASESALEMVEATATSGTTSFTVTGGTAVYSSMVGPATMLTADLSSLQLCLHDQEVMCISIRSSQSSSCTVNGLVVRYSERW